MNKLARAKTTTFIHSEPIITISQKEIDMLKREAVNDPIGRARICLHTHESDVIQEMIIAFRHGTYVRPHKHKGGSESFHIIEGKLQLIFFEPSGLVKQKFILEAPGGKNPFAYRLSTDWWHMAIPMSDFVVLHETTTGPYKTENTQFAPWSPEENDEKGIRDFLERVFYKS